MQRIVIIFLLLPLVCGIFAYTWLAEPAPVKPRHSLRSSANRLVIPALHRKIQAKAVEAAAFVNQKKFNNQICFLIDMRLPSGQTRFFVYDLKKDPVRNAAWVTHGRRNEYWLQGRRYSNVAGSGCTSLGKYKIGYSYTGRFGLAYKLHGLDKTHHKAFERFVVLHAHECVPDCEVNDDICQRDECPTVLPNFLQYIKPVITESKKPVLLWIYE